ARCLARDIPAQQSADARGIRGDRRAARQGGCLRDPGTRRAADRARRGSLLWRDGSAAAAGVGPAGEVRAVVALHAIDRHLLRLSLDLNRLEGLDLRRLLQRFVERLRNQNLVATG